MSFIKNKNILILLFSGIMLTIVWWWQHTRVESNQPAEQSEIDRLTNTLPPAMQAASATSVKSAHLIQILSQLDEIPDLATLAKLTADDEQALLTVYRKTTNMQERIATTWSLAYIGGDAALAAFQHTLMEEFAGRNLTGGVNREKTYEELFLINHVWAIGVMAQNNEKAFGLLKQATDPWFWQKNVKWQSSFNEDIYGILATRSMQAIGMSGRQEVPEILDALSKQPLGNEADPHPLRRNMTGGVVDGAFYYSIIRDQGREGFLQWFLTQRSRPDDADTKFSNWFATDEGKKWHQWSDERDKINLVKQRERLKQAFPKSPP